LTPDEAFKYEPLVNDFWSKQWSDLIRAALSNYWQARQDGIAERAKAKDALAAVAESIASDTVSAELAAGTASDNDVRHNGSTVADNVAAAKRKPVRGKKKAKKPAKVSKSR